jgi:hypothetical protein
MAHHISRRPSPGIIKYSISLSNLAHVEKHPGKLIMGQYLSLALNL